MKTILLFLVIAVNAFGQNEKSGVYLTFNDYLNNKLSYENTSASEKHTIRLNGFLDESHITVLHNGETIKLQKDSVYGFIAFGKPLVRFQNNKQFYLAEKGAVWIFYNEVSVPEGKRSRIEKRYYFSATGNGELVELTLANLKQAFPLNQKFHDILDAQCNNKNISEYDSFYKMFKVNHLLKEGSK